jgi:rubrerythrin
MLLRALRETSPTRVDLWEAGVYDPESLKDPVSETLKTAIEAETNEFTNVYPQMIKDAERDGWDFARECFANLNQVEKVHAALFEETLNQLGTSAAADYFVCEFCGNTVQHKPASPCEVCAAPVQSFMTVR